MTTCLYPPCERAPKYRGLCSSHNATAAKIVATGLVTEAALVAAQKMLPRTKGRGRPAAHGQFRAWLLDLPADPADRY